MSDDSFSFSMPLGNTPSTNSATRYLAPPFDARVADSGQALLLVHGDPEIRRLPLQLVQVFGQCNRLRTFDEHVEEITRALRVPPEQAGVVGQALDELIRRQLLLTEAEVLDRLTSRSDDRPQPPTGAISDLFIRTCGRPGTLERLLTSLARRDLPEGLERVVVLDDDPNPQGRRATKAVVDRHRAGFEGRLTLIDPVDRRAMLERIARDAGTDAERLLWSIEGEHESDEASYGASLNFALLLGAGRLIAIVDDDATFDTFALPDNHDRPALRRRQSPRLDFPEPERELHDGHYHAVDAHPIELHARVLGQGLGRLAEMSTTDPTELLDDLDPQLLSELSGDSRVRLTSSGTLGDPGTGSVQWLFTEPAEHLKPLCESEGRYRELLQQRRMARATGRPEVTTAFALMTTTMTGIDNRDLLLPTQPRGANEDLLFGALVGFLHPDTCQANLPHMLVHMRPEPRRWQSSDLDQPRGVDRGAFLTSRVHALRSSLPHGDAESRAGLLAAALGGLAHAQHDEIAWQLRQELLEVRGQFIEQATATRDALGPPQWLDRDFARVIERHGQISESDERRLATIAEDLPRFLERYATGLPDWVTSWHFCRAAGLDKLLETQV